MKMKIYSVLDTKIGAFSGVFLEMTDASAIRAFSDGVNQDRPDNKWFHHPEDFALYCLGDFLQDNGEILPQKVLSCLVTASALKAMSVPNTNS
ncbi:MAG: nonstructural protein [Microvirus sp.]|nr:MAG: nonstructural protein [Microvirus sp.]